MKKLAIALAVIAATTAAQAQVYHNGYYNNRGTYVAPHYQSSPNSTQYDNYGSSGNVNPYSGHYGTRQPRY